MTGLEPVSEVEESIGRLLDHLDLWLLQQPEWLYLMGLPDRHARRRVANLLARELTTIPVATSHQAPNRKLRRAIMNELKGVFK